MSSLHRAVLTHMTRHRSTGQEVGDGSRVIVTTLRLAPCTSHRASTDEPRECPLHLGRRSEIPESRSEVLLAIYLDEAVLGEPQRHDDVRLEIDFSRHDSHLILLMIVCQKTDRVVRLPYYALTLKAIKSPRLPSATVSSSVIRDLRSRGRHKTNVENEIQVVCYRLHSSTVILTYLTDEHKTTFDTALQYPLN
jgi:hypothetical protein